MLQAKQGVAAAQADPKIRLTEQQCTGTKDMKPLFAEFGKLATKYATALKALNEIGIELSVVADKISTANPSSPFGQAFCDFGSLNRAMEAERSQLLASWTEGVIPAAGRCAVSCDKEGKDFLKNFSTSRSKGTQQLSKLSKEVDKAAKKVKKQGQKPLDDSIERLSQAIQDHDTFLGDQLRKATLLNRSYWCEFLGMVHKVGSSEASLHKKGLEIQDRLSGWQSLSQSKEQIDGEVERVIESSKPTEATSRLAKVRATGYYNPNEFNFLFDESGGGGGGGDDDDEGPPLPTRDDEDEPPPSTDPKGMVRATKSYAAQDSNEITFSAGDFFTLFDDSKPDRWYGEAHGVRGYFPSSHVARMRKAGQ